jgi:hypothetical protein
MKRRPTRAEATREREGEGERERDLKDMLVQLRRTEARVAEAMVTVLRHADPRTLVAFGVVLESVAKRHGRWAR